VVRQLLAQGLLMVEGDYSTLALTNASGAVLRGEHKVLLRREPERPARAAKQPKKAAVVDELPEAAQPVFNRLRAWRGATAKEAGVPAYVVFHDATLKEIAMLMPTTLAALGTISGVGENKLAKYGQGVLDTVASSTGSTGSTSPATPQQPEPALWEPGPEPDEEYWEPEHE
jgi:ATP-dependent DNA helicase RecQ